MFKKVFALGAALCLCLALAACGGSASSGAASGGAASSSTPADPTQGRVGSTMKTTWFDYTVKSVATPDSYADYAPEAEGWILVDVTVSITNTFDEDVPMFDTDFKIYFTPADDEGYDLYSPFDAVDDTMMPLEWTLAKGETVEYHLVYSIPEGSTAYSLIFEEEFEDNTTGDMYTVVLK